MGFASSQAIRAALAILGDDPATVHAGCMLHAMWHAAGWLRSLPWSAHLKPAALSVSIASLRSRHLESVAAECMLRRSPEGGRRTASASSTPPE
jgi:hypothetical protein